MKRVRIVVAILLLVLMLIFILQNSAVIQVRFLAWNLEASQALVIFVTFTGGLLLGWLANSILRLRGGKPAN